MRRDDGGMRRRRPHGWGSLLLALLLLLVLAPIVAHADNVTLAWTAPGDDGTVGTAASYELRASTSPITAGNWATAGWVVATAQPLAAGNRQTVVVPNLSPDTTYWFAIKTTDDVGNQSNISNILQWDWILDTTAPAAPVGLSAAQQGDGTVRVGWTPNGEPDLSGYAIHRTESEGVTPTRLNGNLLNGTEYVDATVPAGTDVVWYQVSAQDASGNESARSATIMLRLGGTAVAATNWTLEPGYPNPSGKGAVVRLPLVVPSAGGSAVVEITTSSGQRVRRFDLGTLPAGSRLLDWDGRNESGRDVAPGVYTAWLIAGNTRTSVRLVRVP